MPAPSSSSSSPRKASVLLCESPVLVRESNMRNPLLGDKSAPGRYACGVCEVCVWRWSRQVERRAVREFESLPPGHVACMLTLTFSDEAIRGAWSDFGRLAWRLFSKALCTGYAAEAPPGALSLKLLGVPELGEHTGRLHLHAVVYGVRSSMAHGPSMLEGRKLLEDSAMLRLVRKCWPHGFVRLARIESAAGVRYVTKYALKGRAQVALALQDHRRRASQARARGAPVPSFAAAWWMSAPRGKRGGLAAEFADRVGQAQARFVRELGDLVPLRRGPAPLVLSRYEVRRARRAAGIDDPASKLKRASRNSEPVEMAARVAAAGGLSELRAARGHVDLPEVDHAKRRIAVQRDFGGALGRVRNGR